MLRSWEVVLEGKTYAKRSQWGNHTGFKGHPVPISKVVDGLGTINSFCQTCWDWSDFHKHRSVSLSMNFMTKWRVTIPIDLSVWSYISLPRFCNSRRSPPPHTPSLVLLCKTIIDIFSERKWRTGIFVSPVWEVSRIQKISTLSCWKNSKVLFECPVRIPSQKWALPNFGSYSLQKVGPWDFRFLFCPKSGPLAFYFFVKSAPVD